MMTCKLNSIQIGKTKSYTDHQGTWETSFFKEPTSARAFVGFTGIEGDSQANKKHHGGPEKAVLVYSADHYPLWKIELGKELPYGGFAENLTVSGLDESKVCIGDVYWIGDVILQVTQARVPCWKIPRFWGIPDLLDRVLSTGRIGWYCRVIREGEIQAGLPVKLEECHNPEWTVARAFQIYVHRQENKAAALELAVLDYLSDDWKETLNQLNE